MNRNVFIFAIFMMVGTGALFGTKVFTRPDDTYLSNESLKKENIKMIVPVIVSQTSQDSISIFCSKELKNNIKKQGILVLCDTNAGKNSIESISVLSISKFLEDQSKDLKVIAVLNNQKSDWDVLVSDKNFARKNPETILTVLSNYFYFLKKYNQNQDLYDKDILSSLDQSKLSININDQLTRLKLINKTLTKLNENSILFDKKNSISLFSQMESTLILNKIKIPISKIYESTDSKYIELLFNKGLIGLSESPDFDLDPDSVLFYSKKEFDPNEDLDELQNKLGLNNDKNNVLRNLMISKIKSINESTKGQFKILCKAPRNNKDAKNTGKLRAEAMKSILSKEFSLLSEQILTEDYVPDPKNKNTIEVVILKTNF